MVDVERIKAEIEALENLNAEEYCKDEVAKIYADFEASREAKIKDYKTALEIFEKFQVVENADFDNATVAQNCDNVEEY